MAVGQIASLIADKGFGFIKPADGTADVFFHHSVVACQLDSLKIGQQVEYELDAQADKARAKSVVIEGGAPVPASTANKVSARSGSSGRHDGSPRPARSGRTFSRPPMVNAECGFVTKMVWKKAIGFVSADKGGAELKFTPNDVVGDKPFQKLKVGDYVQFIRNDYDAAKNPLIDSPTIRGVEAIERIPKKLPRLDLPNNPRARKKKPTWR